MNIKRIVWISKCVGIYANWISNTVRDIPPIPKYEDKRKPTVTNKNSYKGEQVRTL